MHNKSYYTLWALAVIVAVGLLFSFTLRQGHDWDGDFSQYITHAINLNDGLPFTETPYVPNPKEPFLAVAAYPPVFPVLLAPVYHFSGLDLVAMKGMVIIWFMLALVVLAIAWRQELSFKSWLALLIIIGFNFQYWDAKDRILPDFPFMFFTFAALALGQWLTHHQDNQRIALLGGIAVGLLCYLSFATRTIGGVTPAAVLASLLWQTRRINLPFMVVLLTFVTLAGLQTIMIPGTTSGNADYLNVLKYSDLSTVMANILGGGKGLALFWNNGFNDYFHEISGLRPSSLGFNEFIYYLRYPVLTLTFVSMFALALVTVWWIIRGMMHDVTGKASPWLFFVIFYAIVLITWVYIPQRFLLPVFPILLFFAFQYVDQVDQRRQGLHKKSWLSLFLVAVALTYVVKYQKVAHQFGPFANGPFSHETQTTFQYIRQNTPESATFLFRRPRILALLTGRKAGYSGKLHPQPHAVWQFAQSINADYLLVDRINDADKRENMAAFVQASSHKLRTIFKNDQFTLYELIKGS